MPNVDIIDLNNQKVGEIELADEVFAAEVNDALIYEAVRHYQAGQRRGTASTKTRHEVSGSGKKLWRQKGTGRARMGSIRSPLWRHGGTTHGPQPRDYSYKLPRKMQLGALRSALSGKLRDGELRVVQAFNLADHKSKNVRAALNTLEITRKVLLVDGENRNLELGSRNLEGVKLVPARAVTVYDLLAHQQVLLSEAAARKLSESLAGGKDGAAKTAGVDDAAAKKTKAKRVVAKAAAAKNTSAKAAAAKKASSKDASAKAAKKATPKAASPRTVKPKKASPKKKAEA
ncbi:MAG: 50S ribosomal protein L4 [Bryobacteraceae bacterium]|jgi:large subunit ribosomal protein L4